MTGQSPLIENDIGIFQITLEKMEKFRMLLINFYETDDADIIEFMKENRIRRVRKGLYGKSVQGECFT